MNDSSDLIFKPTLIFDGKLDTFNNFKLNTNINKKNAGGNFSIDIYNEKLQKNSDIYSSIKFNSKQTLNRNNILSYEAIITNSVSTTRSINDTPAKFEDIFIRLDSYNFLYSSDYLRSEISTVEALDSTKPGLIPLNPSIKYVNQKLIKDSLSIANEIDLSSLKRNESAVGKPSESTIIETSNSLFFNQKSDKTIIFNKINLNNNLANYYYEHDGSLDDNTFASNLILSSDIFYNLRKNIKPRVKIVYNLDLVSDEIINEKSNSISFNYHNQFSDSRIYGNDLKDNSSRIIYGLENSFSNLGKNIKLNINQSYDFKKNSNYTNLINQTSNFSDIALEAKIGFNNISFQIDARLSNRELEKKEMNYYLTYSNLFDFGIGYNETNSNAFKGLSSDTQSLSSSISKNLNDNVVLSVNSDLDLKNNYSPLTQSLKITLLDECSKLDITFSDQRYNDNYNTQPSETISISFYMDYLGFFGYEQKSNVFFEETGEFNYGR